MKHVIEGVITALILGMISGFVGLFIHVQELDAKYSNVQDKFEFIKDDLHYIKRRVDHLYEKNK